MQSHEEIRALTGLRGLAACYVVVYHFFVRLPGLGIAKTFVNHGYIAVDLFFVLSGFVMAMTYGHIFQDGFRSDNYLTFLYKRLARIYPIYIVVTLAFCVFAYSHLINVTPPTIGTFICNIGLVQTWGVADSIAVPAWSISTEFAAYLLFPILVRLALSRHWTRSVSFFAVALVVLTYVATRSDVETNSVARNGPLDVFEPFTVFPLLRCLAGFTFGLLAFHAVDGPMTRIIARIPGLTGALVAGALVLLAVPGIPGADLVLVLLFVPLIIMLATQRSFTARILGSPLVHWLGLISYSVYLMHRLVDNLLREPLRTGLDALHLPHAFSIAGVFLIVFVLIFSVASFYGIEKPARSWARRVAGYRQGRLASDPAAP